MSEKYMATNLIMRALTLNLHTYDRGPKAIDRFTLDLLEKLLEKIKEFVGDCCPEDNDGNENERDMVMMCYFQQPDMVWCRFCRASFIEYEDAVKHLTKHERHGSKMMKNVPISISSSLFLDENCITKSDENLPKKVKRFLNKDINVVLKKIRFETQLDTLDPINTKVRSDLECILKEHYSSVTLYPFGSRYVGTSSLNSDVDVFIDLEGVYSGRSPVDDFTSVGATLENVKEILQNSPGWIVDRVCLNARVPLLRARNTEHDIRYDLTFSNGLAHRNSSWLWYMFQLQPSSRWLVCYLKRWNAENCLNSYTISLMVIFFFQCRNLLPSVHFLQRDCSRRTLIDGWNVDFRRPTIAELGLELCEERITTLAKEFFTFYSKSFSLATDVVCPFFGRGGIKKRTFHEATYDKIPSEMDLLWSYMVKHRNDEDAKHHFAYNRPFVVQDPFELCHNVANRVPLEKASKYLRLFHLSAQIL